jgi:NodT family efflux transporter outer membrane factor (OMF) lipoprotein
MPRSFASLSCRGVLPLAVLAAAACAPVPDAGPRPLPIAPAQVAAERSLPAAPGSVWPGEGWWRATGDAQLAALIEEGLNGSPDVAAAEARFRRAGGMAQQARGATLPALDLQGRASLDKQSYNNGFPKEFVPKGWQDTGQVAANLGFDLDLWGRNRAALAAATSEARAAAIDARQARLMLATGIASAYVDLARLHDERDVRQAELDMRLATQKLVTARTLNGLDTRGSERQSDAQVATARGNLAAADEALALRRHQIAALLGAGPDRGLAIARPALPVPPAAGLPDGVTTDLVGRRPDIAAARERVEAAASRIKVARADFFPAIRLSALLGVQSLGLDLLTERDSLYGNVGPAVSLPIFRGGALQGNYRSQRAGYDEAVADYDRIVLAAYRDLADTVTSQRLLAQRIADARAALAASQDAYDIARRRYTGGLSTYLDVLTVEDRLWQARLAVAQLDAAARSLDIALIRGLGGGYDAAATAAAATSAKDAPHG